MTYKIIGDSCLDLTEALKKDSHFQMIPLTLMVGDRTFIDDETFDQKEFLQAVKECPECPKTACPSPEMFKEAYHCDAENIFVITLSAPLSGSYNSAVLAIDLYEEEYGKKNICVINSESASSGELNIALLIRDLCEQNVPFEEIVKEAEAYRDRMDTFFVLETLDTLKKNGRLTGLSAVIATTLNIKPVMGADKGNIIKLDQARGINKALNKMTDYVVKAGGNTEEKRLVIAHVNAPERAEYVKELLCSKSKFKEVLITDTAGVSTVYACDGGIVVAL